MKIVVVIPAYNEEKTIGEVLDRIPKGHIPLVIDDASTDRTVEIAKEHNCTVHSHKENGGVGTAFRTGIKHALRMGADIIVNMDADGQMYPEDIPRLVAPIILKKADATIATRFTFTHIHPKVSWDKKIGNRFGSKVISYLTGRRFTDTQCGFRAYSREAAAALTLYGDYTYTQEALLDLVNKGYIVKEVPLYIKGEREGKSRVVKGFFSYGFRVMLIVTRTIRDHKPLLFFGFPGLVCFGLGSIVTAILVLRKIFADGAFFDYPWFLFFSAVLILLGIALILVALLNDAITKHKVVTEEIVKKQRLDGRGS